MTIIIDSRIGSKDLIKYMPKHLARLGRLEYGDASFLGNGPDGVLIPVGLELKRLTDALSSMATGRFAGHQLPGMQAVFKVRYLVVEGIWRANPQTGLLEYPRGKKWLPVDLGGRQFMARELEGFLTTQEIMGGMHLRITGTPKQTAQLLVNLHHWWTDKKWEQHHSHLAFDLSDGPETALLRKPGLLRRMAKELPGIGWGRSRAVEDYFDSVADMVNAEESEWLEIAGVAKGIAPQVVEAIREKRRVR